MRPVTDAFLRTVRGSHGMKARARVVAPGQTGTDPDGTEIPILEEFGGHVSMDATRDVRSLLDMTTDGARWPRRRTDLLAPYGNEIFIERGVQFGGGTTQWVSLGYFRIETPAQEVAPNGAIRLVADDRTVIIKEARLLAPRQFVATATFGAVLEELVTGAYPAAVTEWDDATETQQIGRSVLVEEDRLGAAWELVESVGKTMRFDHRGVLVIRTPPDPSTPVYDITRGRDGVLVEASRELTRKGVYNAVVARGEAADDLPPAYGLAVDLNPNSPTYWHGTFGRVPRFFSSPLLANDAQAVTAATTILRRSLGLPYEVGFGMVPNPALEDGDMIRVSYGPRDPRELHAIETLSVPLAAAGLMTGTTKEKTVVLVGAP